MKFNEFMSALDGGLKHAYLLCGEENYFVDKAREEIFARLDIDAKSELMTFDGDAKPALATIINALAMMNALESIGVPTRVMTSIEMPKLAEPFIQRRALRHFEKGRVVIFGGGTGNPYFSTDSAAALKASEIGADALLKATKVDGIYTADPKKDPNAKKYGSLKYETALEKRLKVMDSAAFALCMDNNIPIVVFDFFDPKALEGVVRGKTVGTVVS